MPATALDPKTALVVIDLQKGIAALPTVHPSGAVAAKAALLAAAFRAAGLPVVLVNVNLSPDRGEMLRSRTEARFQFPDAPDFADLLPELDRRPTDLLVTKRQPNAFYGTELDLQLRRRHVTGVVLAGIATGTGVEATARAAHERAYNVTFASDAMTDVDPVVHDVMVKKIFPRIGEVDTTDAILALLRR